MEHVLARRTFRVAGDLVCPILALAAAPLIVGPASCSLSGARIVGSAACSLSAALIVGSARGVRTTAGILWVFALPGAELFLCILRRRVRLLQRFHLSLCVFNIILGDSDRYAVPVSRIEFFRALQYL